MPQHLHSAPCSLAQWLSSDPSTGAIKRTTEMKNCTNRGENGVVFAAQSPWGGMCTHKVPGDNSDCPLLMEGGKCPPHHNLSPPLDPLKAQGQWTGGYLSPRLGSAFLSPVAPWGSRGGPERLRRRPCPWHSPQLQRAGWSNQSLHFNDFVPATAARNEAGSGEARGCLQTQLLQREGPILK